MRSPGTTRRVGVVLSAAAVAVGGALAPATAQEAETSGIDLDAFIIPLADPQILPIEATVVSIGGGTSTTESSEMVEIALEADVFFEFDESDLLNEATDVLEDVTAQIEDAGVDELHIGGHTDDVGENSYNQTLSEERAEAVEAFLDQQLDGVTFQTEGFGSSEPVAPNETEDGEDDPEGRAMNRRVAISYDR